jgi:hypothetical protein
MVDHPDSIIATATHLELQRPVSHERTLHILLLLGLGRHWNRPAVLLVHGFDEGNIPATTGRI